LGKIAMTTIELIATAIAIQGVAVLFPRQNASQGLREIARRRAEKINGQETATEGGAHVAEGDFLRAGHAP
jgi:hypothetical protein